MSVLDIPGPVVYDCVMKTIYGAVFGPGDRGEKSPTFYTMPDDSFFKDWEEFGLEEVTENFDFIFGGATLSGWRPKREDGSVSQAVFFFPFMDLDIVRDATVYSPK